MDAILRDVLLEKKRQLNATPKILYVIFTTTIDKEPENRLNLNNFPIIFIYYKSTQPYPLKSTLLFL